MTTIRSRRPAHRAAAGVLAAALGAFGVVAAAGTAQAAPAEVTGGHLDWGLKESFRNYILGPIAHGQITPADGATVNDDGTFRFPAAGGTVDADADTASLTFSGSVRFTGHDEGSGPQLELSITDIRVTLDGTGGGLVADVASRSLDTGELEQFDDVAFADLTAADLVDSGGTVSASGIGATLTEEGAPAFADFYPPGTALDPLSFAVTTQPPADWSPDVRASRTSGLDPAGETITVTGSGFDPAANVGTRPPLAGQPTGVYVVFAAIADPWQPSEGAPPEARRVIDQKWVLPAESRAVLDPTGENPDLVELASDGTFSTTLDVAQVTEVADCAVDTCAVLTYAAGGAVNPAHEIAVPLTFGSDPGTPGDDPPGDDTPDPGAVSDALLQWAVKESFLNYISGPIANGGWTLDGVTAAGENGPFRWDDLASGTFDPDEGGQLAFTGSVRFTGHDQGNGPLLDLTISDPQVRVADGAATLLLDVRSRGLENPDEVVELDDAEFAELDLSAVTPTDEGGVLTYADVPATLTEEGAEGFAGFYPAGTELAPVTFAVAEEGANLPAGFSGLGGSGSGGLASTGADPLPLSIAGVGLLGLGTALLAAQRFRRRTTA